ncbi:MAG: GNAT family N-acetyltransferase [Actinomycetota bacterium]|nr:GNAT family N-acetyltransferase [Actinomycetota bacterium]
MIAPGAAWWGGGLAKQTDRHRHDWGVDLRHVRLGDPEVEPLLAGLGEEYELRYGPGDEMATARADDFDVPDGIFVVLVHGDETLAGGGIRRWSADTCEVKRVWTAPHHRRRGYASAVLDALEPAARALGYTYIRAETGPAQPEALAFYTKRGYGEIPAYGPYEVATAFQRSLAADE